MIVIDKEEGWQSIGKHIYGSSSILSYSVAKRLSEKTDISANFCPAHFP
jgi:hypothetical protein